EIGLSPDLAAIADRIRSETQPTARVLWEDCSTDENSSAVLIPLLTDRAILGGAAGLGDSDAGYAALSSGLLAGRSIALWSNGELEAFCRRYNVGWIVAATATTCDRLDRSEEHTSELQSPHHPVCRPL